MKYRVILILLLVVFGLLVLFLPPLVSISSGPCPSSAPGTCHPQNHYESVTFYLFGIGGFYLPSCGGYRLLGSANFVVFCPEPSNASTTTTRLTTISLGTTVTQFS